MAHDSLHEAELRAMEKLGWCARDLWVAALQYGDAGGLADVEKHLASGDHLPQERKAYIAAALWDAELDLQPDQSRLGVAGRLALDPRDAVTGEGALGDG